MTSAEQLKARIKNIAREQGVDPRVLLRIYMMERFLDRVSRSAYRDRFVLKGGMLISYLVGVNLRTTMDVDTSMSGISLDEIGVGAFISDVCGTDADDGVEFDVLGMERVMLEADYPGIRVSLSARFDGTSTPVKVDISTDQAITPAAMESTLPVILAEPIRLLVYPPATIIAEKLHTVLSRATLNTRMRDFYDLHALLQVMGAQLDPAEVREACGATFRKRRSLHLLDDAGDILQRVRLSGRLEGLWGAFRRHSPWVQDLSWETVVESSGVWVGVALGSGTAES